MFGISELAIILIVVILVLGAKRLPELARSAGKSARILKAEAKAMKEPKGGGAEAGAPRVIRGETVPRPDAGRPGPDAGQPPRDHA
ncbi:twin-arginine translocase TatA/TatE family subunit [Streptomyces sp. NPDC059118]|uniref:twin-arginine translocase TatA/TatE family subunit n=1 Tax=unclassified Streptomyces TaxID=2593676 RepID=UPI00368BC2D8